MGVLKIELAKIGYDQQFNEIITITKDNLDDIQSGKMKLCGQQLNNRIDCDSESKYGKKLEDYKVCFTVHDKCDLKNEYGSGDEQEGMVDNGDVYRDHDGVMYGWNRRMNDNVRLRNIGKTFIENNLVLFPPDSQS